MSSRPSLLISSLLGQASSASSDFVTFFNALSTYKDDIKELNLVVVASEKFVASGRFEKLKKVVDFLKKNRPSTIDEDALSKMVKIYKLYIEYTKLLLDKSISDSKKMDILTKIITEKPKEEITMVLYFYNHYVFAHDFIQAVIRDRSSGRLAKICKAVARKKNDAADKTHSKTKKSAKGQPVVKVTKTNCQKKLHNFHPSDDFSLEPYQQYPARALASPHQKGLLLMYETGSGKTMAAIHAAYQLLRTEKVKRVIFVVLANSEKECNFNKEILQYLHLIGERDLQDHWLNLDESCASLNENEKMCIISHNMFHNKYSSEALFREYVQKEGTMLIVDEAHVMANALVPKSTKPVTVPPTYVPKIASVLLHACTKATKVLLLTATPFRNQIQDLFPLFLALTNERVDLDMKYNLNKITVAVRNIKRIVTDYENDESNTLDKVEFKKFFKNLILFKENDVVDFARIKYIDDRFQEHDDYYNAATRKWNVVLCEMSEDETTLMDKNKVLKNKSNVSRNRKLSDEDTDLVRCFEVNSFLARAMVNKLAHLAVSQFAKLKTITDRYGEESYPLIVYSAYIENGVDEIKCFLANTMRCTEYKFDGSGSSSKSTSPKTFAIIIGKTKNRQELVNAFNDGNIDIIVLSDAGATGTDLRGKTGVRQIHIMNIGWNSSSIQQTVGRGWRKGAHAKLTSKDRILRVFIYLSKSYGTTSPNEADEIMMTYVRNKKVIADEIRQVARESFNVVNNIPTILY